MNEVQPSPQAPLPKADRATGRSATEGRGDASGALPERNAFASLLSTLSGDGDPAASAPAAADEPTRDKANVAGSAGPTPVVAPVTDIAALLANIADLSPGSPIPVPKDGVAPPVQAPAGAPAASASSLGLPRDAAASILLPLPTSGALPNPPLPGGQSLPAGQPSPGNQTVPGGKLQVIASATHFAPVVQGAILDNGAPAPTASTMLGSAAPPSRTASEVRDPGIAATPAAPDPRKAGGIAPDRVASPTEAGLPSKENRGATPTPAIGTGDGTTATVDPAITSFRSREAALTAILDDKPADAGGLPAASLPLVADAIREEADRMVAAVPRAHADGTVPGPADGLLRVLKIQLRPAELGLVTVEMRLKDGRLEASLRASRPETTDLLRRTSAALSELLGRSGCQAEVVVLDRGNAQDGATPPATAFPSQGFGGGAQTGGDGAARAHHSERRDGDRPASREDQADETNPRDDRGDGTLLYL